MALFIPTIPQANDNLDFSQGQLLSNNAGLDTVFGIDHYKFSDATVNKGFHNQVTTPAHIGGHPITAANLPLMYAMTAGNLGVIQFSKRANLGAADPSNPITMLQSSSTGISLTSGGGTSNVFDFTGLPRAMCILTASNNTTTLVGLFANVIWTGSVVIVANIAAGNSLLGFAASPILQIKNNGGTSLSDVYWTLQFLRVQ